MSSVTPDMRAALSEAGAEPILDSEFIHQDDGTVAEKTQCKTGVYIRGLVDGSYQLFGPFDAAL